MAKRDRDAKRVKEAIELVDRAIMLLKNEHEMFFLGIAKKPPDSKVRDLKRSIRDLEELRVQNTAAQFQVRRLRAKFNTYFTYWSRTIKQIEEGTYRRQRIVADRRASQRPTGPSADELKNQIRALIRGDEDDEDSTRTHDDLEPARPTMGRAERKAAQGSTGRSETVAQRRGHSVGSEGLLAEYNEVRRSLGGSGSVDSKQLQQVLEKHAAAIKAKTGAREVRFRVVAEDGKPRVKAIPVK